MGHKGMQKKTNKNKNKNKNKTKNEGARRTTQPSWVSHSPDYSFNLEPLFTHLNFSDSGSDYHRVYKDIRMAKVWQCGVSFVKTE